MKLNILLIAVIICVFLTSNVKCWNDSSGYTTQLITSLSGELVENFGKYTQSRRDLIPDYNSLGSRHLILCQGRLSGNIGNTRITTFSDYNYLIKFLDVRVDCQIQYYRHGVMGKNGVKYSVSFNIKSYETKAASCNHKNTWTTRLVDTGSLEYEMNSSPRLQAMDSHTTAEDIKFYKDREPEITAGLKKALKAGILRADEHLSGKICSYKKEKTKTWWDRFKDAFTKPIGAPPRK